eukprot:GAHX01001534.1.p1 GENE.GAHX01001534.1~~GAHX01001534.1.p1  ORF type:complete len:1442 (+),score=342.24 GAHX01001534.1:81-4406(+)
MKSPLKKTKSFEEYKLDSKESLLAILNEKKYLHYKNKSLLKYKVGEFIEKNLSNKIDILQEVFNSYTSADSFLSALYNTTETISNITDFLFTNTENSAISFLLSIDSIQPLVIQKIFYLITTFDKLECEDSAQKEVLIQLIFKNLSCIDKIMDCNIILDKAKLIFSVIGTMEEEFKNTTVKELLDYLNIFFIQANAKKQNFNSITELINSLFSIAVESIEGCKDNRQVSENINKVVVIVEIILSSFYNTQLYTKLLTTLNTEIEKLIRVLVSYNKTNLINVTSLLKVFTTSYKLTSQLDTQNNSQGLQLRSVYESDNKEARFVDDELSFLEKEDSEDELNTEINVIVSVFTLLIRTDIYEDKLIELIEEFKSILNTSALGTEKIKEKVRSPCTIEETFILILLFKEVYQNKGVKILAKKNSDSSISSYISNNDEETEHKSGGNIALGETCNTNIIDVLGTFITEAPERLFYDTSFFNTIQEVSNYVKTTANRFKAKVDNNNIYKALFNRFFLRETNLWGYDLINSAVNNILFETSGARNLCEDYNEKKTLKTVDNEFEKLKLFSDIILSIQKKALDKNTSGLLEDYGKVNTTKVFTMVQQLIPTVHKITKKQISILAKILISWGINSGCSVTKQVFRDELFILSGKYLLFSDKKEQAFSTFGIQLTLKMGKLCFMWLSECSDLLSIKNTVLESLRKNNIYINSIFIKKLNIDLYFDMFEDEVIEILNEFNKYNRIFYSRDELSQFATNSLLFSPYSEDNFKLNLSENTLSDIKPDHLFPEENKASDRTLFVNLTENSSHEMATLLFYFIKLVFKRKIVFSGVNFEHHSLETMRFITGLSFPREFGLNKPKNIETYNYIFLLNVFTHILNSYKETNYEGRDIIEKINSNIKAKFLVFVTYNYYSFFINNNIKNNLLNEVYLLYLLNIKNYKTLETIEDGYAQLYNRVILDVSKGCFKNDKPEYYFEIGASLHFLINNLTKHEKVGKVFDVIKNIVTLTIRKYNNGDSASFVAIATTFLRSDLGDSENNPKSLFVNVIINILHNLVMFNSNKNQVPYSLMELLVLEVNNEIQSIRNCMKQYPIQHFLINTCNMLIASKSDEVTNKLIKYYCKAHEQYSISINYNSLSTQPNTRISSNGSSTENYPRENSQFVEIHTDFSEDVSLPESVIEKDFSNENSLGNNIYSSYETKLSKVIKIVRKLFETENNNLLFSTFNGSMEYLFDLMVEFYADKAEPKLKKQALFAESTNLNIETELANEEADISTFIEKCADLAIVNLNRAILAMGGTHTKTVIKWCKRALILAKKFVDLLVGRYYSTRNIFKAIIDKAMPQNKKQNTPVIQMGMENSNEIIMSQLDEGENKEGNKCHLFIVLRGMIRVQAITRKMARICNTINEKYSEDDKLVSLVPGVKKTIELFIYNVKKFMEYGGVGVAYTQGYTAKKVI